MATRRSIPGSSEPCEALLVEPRCGEEARKLLRSLCRQPRRLRILHGLVPLRRQAAVLAAGCPGAASEAARRLLARCPLAEPVVTVCESRETPPPPASYVVVGRVAVVSLDERLRGREREVAERILRAQPGIVAVYGKEETEGEFRVQRLRLLAGEPVEETVYVEHGLRFPVRLGRVYVNPRLATEHARIAEAVRPGDRILDMFSGIGGFALAASATGKPELVVANDLNPYAVETILRAVEMNRSRLKSRIVVMNADASLLPQLLKPVFTRIIMNLPHRSKEFLPAALSLCSREGCVIHLYTVARTVEEALAGLPTVVRVTGIRRVLDYAPRKYIFRVDLEARGHDAERVASGERGG